MRLSIAFVHEIYPFGGAEKITSILAGYLIGKGYRISIFARQLIPNRINPSINCFLLPETNNIYSKINADYIINIIKEYNIDILIIPTLHIKYITEIKSQTNCKVIFTHHSVPMWEAVNKYTLARKRGEANIFSMIEWFLFQWPKYNIFKKHIHSALKDYKETYQSCDSFVTLTEAYRNEMVRLLKLDPADNKIVAINNPIMANNFLADKPKNREILYVGRMSYADKRVDRLIAIWSKLCRQYPDWNLVLVGDGSERENLEKLAIQLNIKNIKFKGFQLDVSKYYKDASILCLTSTFEGWPLVLTEAQTYGVVPVAYNCSAGVEEILSPNGKNGFLIDCFNEDTFVATLRQLIENEVLRKEIQKNLLTKSKDYSIESIGGQWEKLFSGI